MNRSLWLVLALAPACAQAGLESILNPMVLANPTANPLSMALPLGGALLAPSLVGSPFGGGIGSSFGGGYGGNPLTGFGSPLSGYSSPFGGYGSPLSGYGNPLIGYGSPLGGIGSPLGGLAGASLLRPAIQVAPNLLSLQHQAPQLLTNPYMGGPFSQLPFAQQTRPPGFGSNLLGSTSFGAPSSPYGQAQSNASSQPNTGAGWPSWPGSAKQVTAPPAPVAPNNPYLPLPGSPVQVQAPQAQPQAAAPWIAGATQPVAVSPTLNAAQAASAQALVGSVVDLLKSLATAPPAPSSPVPSSVPFTSPWGAEAPAGQIGAGPLPQVAAPAAAYANPWGSAPVAMPQAAPIQAGPQINEVVTQAQGEDAALTPFDPAYWLLPPEVQ